VVSTSALKVQFWTSFLLFLGVFEEYGLIAPVATGFSGSGKIVFLQQRIQVLVDMYRRVIPISMGRSIDRLRLKFTQSSITGGS
jgi:hypothetical protein